MRDHHSDLPVLRAFVEEAFRVAGDELTSPTSLRDDDHFGFMALCFAYKQLTHAHSAIALLQQDHSLDASILARVMLEGTILLAWCALDSPARAHRWRAYSLVSDYRILRRQQKEGFPVDSEKLRELTARLEQHPEFKTAAATRAIEQTDQDPYKRSWHLGANGARVELRDMAEELDDPLMKQLYDDLSQAPHWTPEGVGFGVKRGQAQSTIGFQSETLKAKAYSVVFLSLSQTQLFLSRHVEPDRMHRMEGVVQRYVERLAAA
jgi:Family of unknown function (DUF5677)